MNNSVLIGIVIFLIAAIVALSSLLLKLQNAQKELLRQIKKQEIQDNLFDSLGKVRKKSKKRKPETIDSNKGVPVSKDITKEQKSTGSSDTDLFLEYENYLGFGYYDKAANALSAYLSTQTVPEPRLRRKLLKLYLLGKQIDSYAEILGTLYNEGVFSKDILQVGILTGLKVDGDNLDLRLLAESELKWNAEDLALNLTTKLRKPNIPPPPPLASEEPKLPEVEKLPVPVIVRDSKGRVQLVAGNVKAKLPLNVEERGIVRVFLEPKEQAKLFMADGDYSHATLALEEALEQTERPMSLFVNLLQLDFITKNISAFIQHYYRFLLKVGNGGEALRKQLYQLGQKLGGHPFFDEVEDVIKKNGSLDVVAKKYKLNEISSELDVKKHELVSEQKIDDNQIAFVKSHHVRIEKLRSGGDTLVPARTYINYGQTEEAAEYLEQVLQANPYDVLACAYLFELH